MSVSGWESASALGAYRHRGICGDHRPQEGSGEQSGGETVHGPLWGCALLGGRVVHQSLWPGVRLEWCSAAAAELGKVRMSRQVVLTSLVARLGADEKVSAVLGGPTWLAGFSKGNSDILRSCLTR